MWRAFVARSAVGLGIVVALIVGARTAAAQQPQDETRYRQLVDQAVSEFAAGRFEEALSAFRRAHAVIPNARTLRGIGMAAFETRQYVDARRALEQSLIDTRRPLTAEQRVEVERILGQARGYTGRYRVRLSPPDAQLSVDGVPASLEPDGSLLMGAGTHVVSAALRGYRTASRQVVVNGDEDEELLMPLEVESAFGGGEGGGGAVTGPGGRRRRPTSGGAPGLGIAVTATGGALLVGSLVTGIILVRNLGELEDCRDAGRAMEAGSFCMNEPDLVANRDLSAGLTIGFGVAGLVGVATGIVLIATSGDDDPAEASVRCVPGIGGLSCAGRF